MRPPPYNRGTRLVRPIPHSDELRGQHRNTVVESCDRRYSLRVAAEADVAEEHLGRSQRNCRRSAQRRRSRVIQRAKDDMDAKAGRIACNSGSFTTGRSRSFTRGQCRTRAELSSNDSNNSVGVQSWTTSETAIEVLLDHQNMLRRIQIRRRPSSVHVGRTRPDLHRRIKADSFSALVTFRIPRR
jgi:hypothetical protein